MNKFGLTNERFNQLMEYFNGDLNEIEIVVEECGVEAVNNGYDIFDFNGTGILEVLRLDATMTFQDDEEAVHQAIQDGVKFIPVDELPENFDRRYLGWIDTPENREAIEEYCKKFC